MSDVDILKFLFGFEVFANEILSLYRIVPHIELHDAGYGFLVGEAYAVEFDVLAYEIGKF